MWTYQLCLCQCPHLLTSSTMALSQLASGFVEGKSPWGLLGLPSTLGLEAQHHSAQMMGQRKTQVGST